MPVFPVHLSSLALPILQSPLASAVVQAVSISAAGNIAAQLLSEYRNKRPLSFDFGKFIRFLIIAVIMAPMNYCWQALLERTFPVKLSIGEDYAADANYNNLSRHHHCGSETHLLSGNDPEEENEEYANMSESSTREGSRSRERQPIKLYIWHSLLKLLVDCFLLGTWWNVILFLVLNGTLNLESGLEIMRRVKTDTVPIVLDAFKIWPFAMIIGLTLLPMEKRIVFYSSVNFFWAIYMSLVASRES